MHALDSRLLERAAVAGLTLDDSLRARLLAYYQVLLKWNARINLTALTDLDEAIDRLLLEPVAAARFLQRGSRLIDLGSGGGSPAIPLALALHAPRLVMVESKSRKAAFLREAARVVDLPATVEAERFEVVAAASGYRQAFDVVSIRAVRMSPDAIAAASHFMAPDGCLALFVSPGASLDLPTQLGLSARTRLLDTAELLTVSADVPRGT